MINGETDMGALSRCVSLACLMLLSACVESGSVDNEFYKEKMKKNMGLASIWLIEEGVSAYAKGGKQALHRKLVDEWGVLLWIDPWVETEDYLAQFRIKARGINYQILNLHRNEIAGELYEFWIVKVVAKPWSGETNRSVFYVAKTDGVYGRRQILKTSDQFFDAFRVVDENVIRFPIDSLKLRYEMEAWEFPDNYRDSPLKDTKVIMDENGILKSE